ncbi:MAG: DegV family protein [Chloroflexota bacterium]|nr:DegV family protein [Chloroflexota bacterium]
MPKIKIITDSTCDLPASYFHEYAIGVVPVNIQFGNATFQEGVTIDQTTFYKKVDELGIIPQTSQPSVGQFAEAYRAAAREGFDTILSLHVTGKLSGTMNSATLAAQEVADEIKVIPYDSLCGSAALGFMCVDAVEMARAGKSVEQILARLDAARPRVGIFLSLATLRYAQMSGRISGLQGFIASLLNVKPIISLHEGELAPSGRVRSRQAAMNQLIDLAKQAAGEQPIKFAALHAQARPDAEQLLERGKREMNCVDTFVDDLAISLAVHFGPGVIGTVVYPAT